LVLTAVGDSADSERATSSSAPASSTPANSMDQAEPSTSSNFEQATISNLIDAIREISPVPKCHKQIMRKRNHRVQSCINVFSI